jgi:hypothetical protein
MFSALRNSALVALAVAFVAIAPAAQAFVAYTANNPAAHFTLFTYDSPGFITTDTVVPAADLAYFAPPPLNFISSVEFNPSSTDPAHLGLPEVAVFQYSGGPDQSFSGNQFRWYPLGTFTQYGVTPGLGATPGFPNSQSFGFPNSQLVVAAPEPSTIGLLSAGLFGLLALRRRSASL